MYLSLNLCKQLKLVHEEFPHIDVSQEVNNNDAATKSNVKTVEIPQRPEIMPFDPVEENIHKLEEWLSDAFAATTFNTEMYPLPEMTVKKPTAPSFRRQLCVIFGPNATPSST